MFIRLSFLFWWVYYHLPKYSTLFFNTLYNLPDRNLLQSRFNHNSTGAWDNWADNQTIKIFVRSFIHSLSQFNLPLIGAFYVTNAYRALKSHDLSGGELILDHIHTFFEHTRTWRPPRMRDQLNAGASSKTTRTWKTIHILSAPIHSNKVHMKGRLWRPNDIRGLSGPKASWHFVLQVRKTPKNIVLGKLVPTEDWSGSASWQALMLPPSP